MSIINNTYFVDEIFIPHAKPSITDNVTGISAEIVSFINTYEKECLIKTLGYKLYSEFEAQLDSTKPNGLKVDAPAKWNDLLNGKTYTKTNGDEAHWSGIRQKNLSSSDIYDRSFIADYVYFFYEKSTDDDRVGVGNVQQEAANALKVSKTPKVVAAWRRFFETVQGSDCPPAVYFKSNGVGVDWLTGNGLVTLYEFITDSNLIVADTYANWKPTYFVNMNQFGL